VEFITRCVPDLRTERARWDRIASRFVESDPSSDE
jgi:hypothetical protein